MALKKKANLVEELDCEDVFAASEAEELEFEDIFAASGAEVQQQIADSEYWRQKVGVRKAGNEDITKERKSTAYQTRSIDSAQEGETEPLPEAPQEAELFQCTVEGKLMQHYSNIHRMKYLAATHPLVSSVIPHKLGKAVDVSQFDAQGVNQ